MSESRNLPRTYDSAFGFEEPQAPRELIPFGAERPDIDSDMVEGGEQKYDIEKDILRLIELQRGFGPTEVSSTGDQVGPFNAQFTNFQRSGPAQVGDVNRLVAGVNAPFTDNLRLGANVMAQQDDRPGGVTIARPGLNLGYGPLSLNAGYIAQSSPYSGGPTTVSPSYGMNVNLPIAGGEFSGGVSQAVGQQNPYMYAGYQFPFLNGTLGFELSSADRLRNLAALLAYRRAF